MTREELIKDGLANGATPEQIKSELQRYRVEVGAFDDEKEQQQTSEPTHNVNKEEPGLYESLMPRSATSDYAMGDNSLKSIGKQVLAGGLDALSLPGRAIAALGKNEDESYLESLSKKEGNGVIDDILRDPATLATLPTGGIGGGAVKLLGNKVLGMLGKKGVEQVAEKGILQLTKQAGKQGLKQGLNLGGQSAAIHQAENVEQGKNINLKDATLETVTSGALGGALPVAGKLLGEGAKKLGVTALKSSLKASKAIRNAPGGDERLAKSYEKALDEGIVTPFGGLGKAEEKINEKLNKLDDARISAAEGQGKVNLRGSLAQAKDKIEEMYKNQEIDAKTYKQALNHAVDLAEDVANKTKTKTKSGKEVATGWMPMDDALKHRQLIDKNTKWNESVQSYTQGESVFNRAYRDAIEKQIGEKSPEVRELTKKMGEYMPAKRAIEDRASQQANNYPVSLMDLGALTAGGVLGGTSGGTEGAGAGGLGALGLLGARRLISTPGGASILYGLGKKAVKPGKIQKGLQKVSQRAMAQNFREENKNNN